MNTFEKSIGGYLGLELNSRKNRKCYESMLFLNSAIGCLLELFKRLKPEKIFLPKYSCHTLKKLSTLNCKIEYYNVDVNLKICQKYDLQKDQFILYTNYFGINDENVNEVIRLYGKNNVIIDNSQSLFSSFDCLANIYSLRKTIGVPDGGIISSQYLRLNSKLEKDSTSSERFMHLLMRVDGRVEDGLSFFRESEKSIGLQEPKLMSDLTLSIFKQVDHFKIMKKRLKNFYFLKKNLDCKNKFIVTSKVASPICYPLHCDSNLNSHLKKNLIFTPKYWPNLIELNDFENSLVQEFTFLPIDQNLDENDLNRMINTIKEFSYIAESKK
jgi:hypothetical protein